MQELADEYGVSAERIRQLEAQIEAEFQRRRQVLQADFQERKVRFEAEVLDRQRRFREGVLRYVLTGGLPQFANYPREIGTRITGTVSRLANSASVTWRAALARR